jgi:type II secretory pathway component PulK
VERMRNGERGEGVISAAIAVLIMAFLGAAMWVGFNTIWNDAEENIGDQVEEIGDDTGDGGADVGE